MSTESLLSAENEQLVGLLRNSKMEARMEHQTAKRYRSLYGFTSLIGVGAFLLVAVWCTHYRGGFAWTSDPGLQFNWHPILMVLGLVVMFSQSMLVYRTGRTSGKPRLKLAHAALHLLAFVFAVIGLKAVFDFHNNSVPPKANLYSLHSWIGLVCVILFSMQYVAGFVTFLFPGLRKDIRRISLPVHTAVGVATFTLAICTSLIGLNEKAIFIKNYEDLKPEAMVINFIGVLLAIYGLLVLYLVNEPTYKRAALPEEELALAEQTE